MPSWGSVASSLRSCATAEAIEDNLFHVADDPTFDEPMNGSDRLH